jgi:GNAT superfamily N-acetyltransferase
MLNIFRIRWNQFLEEAREKSFREAFRKTVAKCIMTNQIVVPVYNSLATMKQSAKADATSALEFLVVNKDNVESATAMQKTPSRKLKVVHNTRSGYYAYAVVSNGEIIGDIWCATPKSVQADPIHPDLPWLGITCAENDAYMFDMYVIPDSRGKVITSFLLGGALNHLKGEGFNKVYGFYEKNNLPALWTHRLFGYSELGKRRSFRFLFYKKTELLAASE